MFKDFKIHPILQFIWLFAFLVLVLGMAKAVGIYKVTELNFRQDQFAFEKLKFQKELTRDCQEMSATTTNTKWTYKNCLKELTGLTPTFQD